MASPVPARPQTALVRSPARSRSVGDATPRAMGLGASVRPQILRPNSPRVAAQCEDVRRRPEQPCRGSLSPLQGHAPLPPLRADAGMLAMSTGPVTRLFLVAVPGSSKTTGRHLVERAL